MFFSWLRVDDPELIVNMHGAWIRGCRLLLYMTTGSFLVA